MLVHSPHAGAADGQIICATPALMLEHECARCHACQGSNRAAGDTSHDEPSEIRPAIEQEIPDGSTDTAGSGSRADRTADHSSDGESNEPAAPVTIASPTHIASSLVGFHLMSPGSPT